jgi:hypothetical protein
MHDIKTLSTVNNLDALILSALEIREDKSSGGGGGSSSSSSSSSSVIIYF